jgi:hypothetical protein
MMMVPSPMGARTMEIVYESSPVLLRFENRVEQRRRRRARLYMRDWYWRRRRFPRPEPIPVHQLYARPSGTQRLLEDANIDLETWLARKNRQKMKGSRG